MKRLLVILLALPVFALARVWPVGDGAHFTTIQAAVLAAGNHDTIKIFPGQYNLHDYTVNKPLTFLGEGMPRIHGGKTRL